MKTTFTANFLKHLSSKKKNNEGFTLIELLVVIIIVGVLAAIALPSFLSQIGKARGSEAKSSLGTINRAQQAFRLERNTFASDLDDLDAEINGKFYAYTSASGAGTSATFATHQAAPAPMETDLKGYSSGVSQVGDAFAQLICETPENSAAAADVPAAEGDVAAETCAGGSLVVE